MYHGVSSGEERQHNRNGWKNATYIGPQENTASFYLSSRTSFVFTLLVCNTMVWNVTEDKSMSGNDIRHYKSWGVKWNCIISWLRKG